MSKSFRLVFDDAPSVRLTSEGGKLASYYMDSHSCGACFDPLKLRDWLTENFDPAYRPPLKPCPFCGSSAVRMGIHGSQILCEKCCAEGPLVQGTPTRVIYEKWNNRSTPAEAESPTQADDLMEGDV